MRLKRMFQLFLHQLSGLEKGVSGLLFAPKWPLTRSDLEIRPGLASAKTT
jgi:hypothetical protein